MPKCGLILIVISTRIARIRTPIFRAAQHNCMANVVISSYISMDEVVTAVPKWTWLSWISFPVTPKVISSTVIFCVQLRVSSGTAEWLHCLSFSTADVLHCKTPLIFGLVLNYISHLALLMCCVAEHLLYLVLVLKYVAHLAFSMCCISEHLLYLVLVLNYVSDMALLMCCTAKCVL